MVASRSLFVDLRLLAALPPPQARPELPGFFHHNKPHPWLNFNYSNIDQLVFASSGGVNAYIVGAGT
jgi:hypothetical protein